MGDPKKQRKKYSAPLQPWNKERILEEKELKKQYGVRRKNELWKMNSFLRNILRRAKVIIGSPASRQAEIEKGQLLKKAHSLGIIEKNAMMEDILNISLKKVMDRRLQTILVKRNLARTVNQARQFIVHGHINVGDRKITFPSYLVGIDEEQHISFYANSPFNSKEHAERSEKKVEKKDTFKKSEKEAKGEKQIKKEEKPKGEA